MVGKIDLLKCLCISPFPNWERLFTGTVPVNKDHLTGTVPVNKEHLTGTLQKQFFPKIPKQPRSTP